MQISVCRDCVTL